MALNQSTIRYALPILKWSNSNGRHQYQVTPADRLTLIRSVWKEGKPYTEVAFTLLQRFGFLYPTYKSLSSFIRAYSQPINPRWFPNGDLHLAAISALKSKKQTSRIKEQISILEKNAQRRPAFASTPESDIPKSIVDIVDSVLSGNIESPIPKAIHFINSKATPEDSQQTAKQKALAYAEQNNLGKAVPTSSGFGSGVNWFFTGKNPDENLTAINITPHLIPAEIITRAFKRPPSRIPTRSSAALSLAVLALGIAIIWISTNE